MTTTATRPTEWFTYAYDGSGLPLTVPVVVEREVGDLLAVRFTGLVPPRDLFAERHNVEVHLSERERLVRRTLVTSTRPNPASFNWLD